MLEVVELMDRRPMRVDEATKSKKGSLDDAEDITPHVPNSYLSELHAAGHGSAQARMSKIRQLRKMIFRQTEGYLDTPDYVKTAHSFSHRTWTANSICEYRESLVSASDVECYVVSGDVLDTAHRLCISGREVAVLCNACNGHAGGGVRDGSGAQEEDMYRRTDIKLALMNSIPDRRAIYPLNGDAVSVRPVTVLRGSESRGYPWMRERSDITAIICAAEKYPVLRPNGGYDARAEAAMFTRLLKILHASKKERVDVLVMTPFGCGAVRNPAAEVARLLHAAVQYVHPPTVVVSIKTDHNTYNAANPNGAYEHFAQRFPKVCCSPEWEYEGWCCVWCGRGFHDA